ncbi:hypothetical protein EJ04DRAFT_576635 [Polyplosphaeria fusca]|uniref:Uncharacterized protein n=1 Tax=Polyplosphaeria fusca TaxID=682080 RepID=A0A9P4R1J3_9PLEO|nr:hypothetical protein EJ04DRAFT_576635 [Polyplosphaeria fusca]
MAHYFPFVLISAGYGPGIDVLREKPFLSLVIAMLGCVQDRIRQRELVLSCRKYITMRVVEASEKGLDLLQGILVLVHWYLLQFELPNQRGVLMHLAMGLVVDMSLNKSPFTRNRVMKVSEAANGYELKIEGVVEHTLEERRAYLGCVYLSSVLSKSVLNTDAVHFSDYTAQCCQVLEGSNLASDRYLLHLMDLQRIVERFETARSLVTKSQALTAQRYKSCHKDNGPDYSTLGISHGKQWNNVLTAAWDSIRTEDRTELLLVQYCYARACIFEAGLDDSQFLTVQDRFETLNECVARIRDFHDAFFSVASNPDVLFDVPSHVFGQSNHIMSVAGQICSIQCEEWSGKRAGQDMGLVELMDSTLLALDSIFRSHADMGMQPPPYFNRLAPMARAVQNWYMTRFGNSRDGGEATVAVAQDVPVEFDFLEGFFDFDDSLWLQGALDSEGALLPSGTRV